MLSQHRGILSACVTAAMPCHNLLWAQNLPLCLPPSLPTPRYAACRSRGRACYAHARSPAPSPAWTRAIVPSRSFLPQSVRSSFLPSLQQIRSNQRVSQLHPLSRAHLQPGDTTDRQTERRAGTITRQAHTTGHRASSSVIGDGRKCT